MSLRSFAASQSNRFGWPAVGLRGFLNNILLNNGSNPAQVVRAILAVMLETRGLDIIDTVGMDDGCVLNPGRFCKRTWMRLRALPPLNSRCSCSTEFHSREVCDRSKNRHCARRDSAYT